MDEANTTDLVMISMIILLTVGVPFTFTALDRSEENRNETHIKSKHPKVSRSSATTAWTR